MHFACYVNKATEKVKTHILCPKKFYENRTVYEIMWKNMV